MSQSALTPLVVTLWVLNVLVDSGGQLAFKAAASGPAPAGGMARWRAMASRPWLWLGVACYVAEFVMWLAFLSVVFGIGCSSRSSPSIRRCRSEPSVNCGALPSAALSAATLPSAELGHLCPRVSASQR